MSNTYSIYEKMNIEIDTYFNTEKGEKIESFINIMQSRNGYFCLKCHSQMTHNVKKKITKNGIVIKCRCGNMTFIPHNTIDPSKITNFKKKMIKARGMVPPMVLYLMNLWGYKGYQIQCKDITFILNLIEKWNIQFIPAFYDSSIIYQRKNGHSFDQPYIYYQIKIGNQKL